MPVEAFAAGERYPTALATIGTPRDVPPSATAPPPLNVIESMQISKLARVVPSRTSKYTFWRSGGGPVSEAPGGVSQQFTARLVHATVPLAAIINEQYSFAVVEAAVPVVTTRRIPPPGVVGKLLSE
jgi:hypothetical protein